jgi:hypothetical protein
MCAAYTTVHEAARMLTYITRAAACAAYMGVWWLSQHGCLEGVHMCLVTPHVNVYGNRLYASVSSDMDVRSVANECVAHGQSKAHAYCDGTALTTNPRLCSWYIW